MSGRSQGPSAGRNGAQADRTNVHMTLPDRALLACPECDALQRETRLPARGVALCFRCGARLYRDKPHGLDRALAFALAAAILFAIANAHAFASLDAQGLKSSATLLDTALALFRHRMASVAILVLVTAILVPALELAALLYMLLPLHFARVPRRLALAFRLAHALRPWAMVDVFLVGAIVSLVKLTQIAQVHAGAALAAVVAYILLVTAALASFEPRALWARAEALA